MKSKSAIQSDARALASEIKADGEFSHIIAEEITRTEQKAYAPIKACFALFGDGTEDNPGELGDKANLLPKYDSGPEGTNNPDRYVERVTKKGNIVYGSFLVDFARDLEIVQRYVRESEKLKKAGEKEAPSELSHLTAKGDKWLSAEKGSNAQRIRAATELVLKSIRIHQMQERLQDYPVRFELVTTKDKDGEDILDERTLKPILLVESFPKIGKNGKQVTDSDGDPVFVDGQHRKYMGVGEFIGLEPEYAASMEGGFTFENLLKASAKKREEEKKAQSPASSFKTLPDTVTGMENTVLYFQDDMEKKISRLVEECKTDETKRSFTIRLSRLMDVIYEHLDQAGIATDPMNKREEKDAA